jgi:hypothetical protein
VTIKEQEAYAAMHKYYHINFSMNKQNHAEQACKHSGSVVLTHFTTEWTLVDWL